MNQIGGVLDAVTVEESDYVLVHRGAERLRAWLTGGGAGGRQPATLPAGD